MLIIRLLERVKGIKTGTLRSSIFLLFDLIELLLSVRGFVRSSFAELFVRFFDSALPILKPVRAFKVRLRQTFHCSFYILQDVPNRESNWQSRFDERTNRLQSRYSRDAKPNEERHAAGIDADEATNRQHYQGHKLFATFLTDLKVPKINFS